MACDFSKAKLVNGQTLTIGDMVYGYDDEYNVGIIVDFVKREDGMSLANFFYPWRDGIQRETEQQIRVYVLETKQTVQLAVPSRIWILAPEAKE